MQSAAKATGWPSSSPSLSATGFRLNCGIGPALGPAEMRDDDDAAPRCGQVLQPGNQPLQPRRVGDLAVLHRHVEVGAHEHALALEVGLAMVLSLEKSMSVLPVA